MLSGAIPARLWDPKFGTGDNDDDDDETTGEEACWGDYRLVVSDAAIGRRDGTTLRTWLRAAGIGYYDGRRARRAVPAST